MGRNLQSCTTGSWSRPAGARERRIPHEVVLDRTAEADPVVMATHGRTGLGRFLLGSVTEKVVRNAPVPVHVVRITDEE